MKTLVQMLLLLGILLYFVRILIGSMRWSLHSCPASHKQYGDESYLHHSLSQVFLPRWQPELLETLASYRVLQVEFTQHKQEPI